MSPAMNTDNNANNNMPYRPEPVPPGSTSPSMMLTSGAAPPIGVKLSCVASTAPVDVPVVDDAKRPEVAGPNRVSFPSMFPPAWVAVAVWDTPSALSFGLPFVSNTIATSEIASQSTTIALSTARPCFTSPAIFPNIHGNANGIASSNQIWRRLVIGFGFSNGWDEFALYGPPPFWPTSLIAS